MDVIINGIYIPGASAPKIINASLIDKLKNNSFGVTNKSKTEEYISAEKKININELKEKIFHHVRKIHIKRFPYNNFLYPEVD